MKKAIWVLYCSILVRIIPNPVQITAYVCDSGGPRASGVEMVLNNAQQFRTILGEGYDIVGFDLRGTFTLS